MTKVECQAYCIWNCDDKCQRDDVKISEEGICLSREEPKEAED